MEPGPLVHLNAHLMTQQVKIKVMADTVGVARLLHMVMNHLEAIGHGVAGLNPVNDHLLSFLSAGALPQ